MPKCFLRLIFIKKSSLVYDILLIYMHFDIMSLQRKSKDIMKILYFDKCSENTFKINDYKKSLLSWKYLYNDSLYLYEILNLR